MYREAQNFFWDSASMGGATQAALSRVDVYFSKRPDRVHNRSGIASPGATMFIVPTINSVPFLDNILDAPRARLEYDSIIATSDASVAAKFTFSPPVSLNADREYSLIMHYDGDEDFLLWQDVKGKTIVGSTQVSTGVVDKDVGKYYTVLSSVPTTPGNTVPTQSSNSISTGSLSNTSTANASYSLSNWRAVSDTALKFATYAARYAFNGDRNLAHYVVNSSPANSVITSTSNAAVNTATGCVTFRMPCRRYEYVCFDRRFSNWRQVLAGERCFHKRPYHRNHSAGDWHRISCVANSDVLVCSTVNFNTLFLLGGIEKEHIVCWSRDHDGAGRHRVHLGEVIEIVSNTSIRTVERSRFTNSQCYFHISPVGTVDIIQDTMSEGVKEPMVVLRDIHANGTNRFANHCVEEILVSVGGTAYDNSDIVTVSGYEHVAGVVEGGFNCAANIVTNSTGGIVNVLVSNMGCGFVNTSAIVITIANSTGGTSNGSGCNLSCNVGSTIVSEFLGQDGRGGHIRHCRHVNIDLDECGWALDMDHPSGSFYSAFHRLVYYTLPHTGTHLGRAFYCDSDDDADIISIRRGEIHKLRGLCRKRRCLPSWSNEWNICWGANGTPSNACGGSSNSSTTVPPGSSNGSVLIINTFANGDFSSVLIEPQSTTTTFSKYIINNDYTNEHTNYGNALAKGIENKVVLANDHFAEDLRVFLTAYRPANTDIQVYARIYNSTDSEAFDDKDWTRLELKEGANLYSSTIDATSFVELTYGFQNVPNVEYALAGTVTLALSSNTITGVDTTFSANLAVGDLVHIYQPLFPNNEIVASVASITSNTSLDLDTQIANNGLVGTGLLIEKLQFPHQAFNNTLNDNIVRYYNSDMVKFDNFNSYQLKVVLLSDSDMVVPKVDDIRSVGVSS